MKLHKKYFLFIRKIILISGLACSLSIPTTHKALAKSATYEFDKAYHNSQDLTGEIYITSNPSQADVVIGGALLGKTPLTIKKMPRDSNLSLLVKKEGFESWSTTVAFGNEHRKEYKNVFLKMK